MNQELAIDTDFPGGNIVLEELNGDDIYLHQDLRDTDGGWFYWAFRVRGAQGKRLTFHFTSGDVLGVRGPTVSYDDGASWQWLGDDIVNRDNHRDIIFTHDFLPEHTKVLFAFCPVYTQANLDLFLTRWNTHYFLRREILCQSRAARAVEVLRLGNPAAKFQLLLTCRHHACEAMASYFLEGLLEAILSEDETGIWFRANVDCAVMPFMDKDGVETGDQGKNRAPHDHNRDYSGEVSDSIYPEVAALRQWIRQWIRKNKVPVVLDFHCPHIRGNENEEVYFVGVPNQKVWQEVMRFSVIWERLNCASIPYENRNNIPFGEKWNTGSNYAAGKSFTKWASELPEIRLATAMELPYANAGEVEVTPASYREMGRSLAKALRAYVEVK